MRVNRKATFRCAIGDSQAWISSPITRITMTTTFDFLDMLSQFSVFPATFTWHVTPWMEVVWKSEKMRYAQATIWMARIA
jgi:hypothetical protein